MKTIQLNTIKYFRIFKNEGFIKLHCHIEVFFLRKSPRFKKTYSYVGLLDS
jgi:hypothetical protein